MRIYLIVLNADDDLQIGKSGPAELESGDETTHLDFEVNSRRFQIYIVPVGEVKNEV